MKPSILALVFTGLMFASASAVTVVWQGGVGNLNDTNWTVDSIPNSAPGFFGDFATTYNVTINGGTVNGFNNDDYGTARTGDTLLITGGASITGDYLMPVASETANYITLESGNITMNSFNAFRSSSGFTGQINFTGAAGSATVVQTNLTGTDAEELAGKIGAAGGTFSFFAIDGTMIFSGLTYDPSDLIDPVTLADVNASLALKVVNNRYFEITEAGGAQTLHLRAIPEPSALLLSGIGALLLLRRRR